MMVCRRQRRRLSEAVKIAKAGRKIRRRSRRVLEEKTIMMKKIILIILIILFAWAFLRFLIGGSEDDWICVNGEWAKHGVPVAPMPTEPCEN